MTESQYQALVRIVAEAYKRQREVKKDVQGVKTTAKTDAVGD